METFPSVPEGLEEDLASGHDFVFRWGDEGGQRKEVQFSWMDPNARIRIVLRPFIEVEASGGEGEPKVVTTTIPLESVVAIDVDTLEVRHGVDEEVGSEEDYEVVVPVSRWVRHPDRGLLRLAVQ